ncbi:phosphate signaling complex protein PhoU [Flavobacterium gawalongense]|uniref:Phosphate-specific transport system accessory protein PhoU n=1 Tax=Flavobacterium gawalongense TaxID=2594432 RepID=A0A553BLS8_9FLAO|nr:phosphate signaling complex protein PhoU [Flavobacterium gawalongense]TRX01216.1 phosphate signaling complex protein PhoU [Flavobacterium gawalongense]TRX05259.1 phosphate signaling complex protein PhoU [Flavobacterium gawalongense]TRX09162.1 phosphate signaling complex protein PhoU [Flavobacterium gawalongense]TRX09203.1 phosphate signaling complex protein PhoU [Flavobacterium gawalongense]TRX26660.1 phosphate signaling complex protein PhoU [Flavobacterium gawalongense]
MASHFEIELEKLKNVIVKIGKLAEIQVSGSVNALLSEPVAEGKEVKKTENKIDKLDVKIDEICQSIFALQQPVASDLRFIMSAMQISNEIERIGDLAISIIKKAKNIKDKHDLIVKFNITDIARQVEVITIKTNECFLTRNENTIGEIFILNNTIKNESDDAIHNIINEMKSNSKTVVSGTNLVIVLKHLERISEHCTNIAEYVYFMINAKIIKHEKFGDKKSDN